MKSLSLLSALLVLSACTAQTVPPVQQTQSSSSSMEEPQSLVVEWRSSEISKDATGAPLSEISLIQVTTGNALITTACVGTVSPVQIEHTTTAVSCVWEGKGYEYAVFPVPNGIMYQKRAVEDGVPVGEWERI